MSQRTENPQLEGGSANPAETPDRKRRRLLQGGLASAPVLMTIVSRPALGQQCLTPSAFGSGNLSQTGGGGVPCNGHGPSYWAADAHLSEWQGYVAKSGGGLGNASKFSDVFSPVVNPTITNGTTLLDVLGMSGGPVQDVASHVVAALLNASGGLNVVPTVQSVKDIWSEFATTGHFAPTAGVQWDAAQIIVYLNSTMPF